MVGLKLKILIIIQCFVSFSYGGVTGTLEGKIRDKVSGQLLPGVNVVIVETGQGAATDLEGFYRITNLRAGEYTVRVTIIGYRVQMWQKVRILPDLRTVLNVELEGTILEMPPVEVGAERPILQRDVTGTAVEIPAATIIRLPIDTYKDVIGLQAGTTLEGNVRGGKVSEVNYLVDGVPLQDLMGGGAAGNLPRAAISQMSVKTGGFDSEYGNALSGIVNLVTRGGSNQHEFSFRTDKDNLVGGTEFNKTNRFELWSSGPIQRDKIYYFGAADYTSTDTRWWQDFQHFFTSPIQRDFSSFAKITYQPKPELNLSGQLIYSSSRWRDYEFSWRYNLSGLPPRGRDFLRLGLNWSHALSKKTFYTLNFSYSDLKSSINDGQPSTISALPYEYDFFLQYVLNGKREWWGRSNQGIYSLRGDLTTLPNRQSTVRIGFEFNQYEVNSHIIKLEPQTTYFGKPLLDQPLNNFSSAYNYYPRSGSIFIQDKFDFSDDGSVASIGLRYDFLDPRASRPAVELVPTTSGQYQSQLKGYVPAKMKNVFGPRFGMALPITPNSFLFVNFGVYYQFPLFDYLYQGIDNVKTRYGVNVLVGNPDLQPERTQSWEISMRYAWDHNTLLSATYFHKETQNQIDAKTFVPTNSRIAGDYGFAEYVNNPYAAASGYELVVSRENDPLLSGSLSYTYMNAEGLSETIDQGINYYQWGFQIPPELFPLSWDQRHTIKINLSSVPFYGIRFNVVGQFYTARPFTYYPSADGFHAADPNQAFVPNNRRMKNVQTLDVRIEKSLPLKTIGLVEAEIYADIRNAFNSQNIRWMDSSGRIGGELEDPSSYFTGRRSAIGIRVQF
jgi:outer membrane receptor protein involved in Fe transport